MIKETNKQKEELEAKLSKQLDLTMIELETIKSEFNVKMQKIRLQELELENKVLAQSQGSQKLADKLEELSKKVAVSEKQLNKKQAKIDDLRKDIEIAKEQQALKVKSMQEEYDELKERLVQMSSEMEYWHNLASQKAKLK